MSSWEARAEGIARVEVMLGTLRHETRTKVRRMLSGAASYSEVIMKQYAPGSIRMLTDHDEPSWLDQSTLEAAAGVRPATNQEDRDPRFPAYVHGGTGIYRPDGPSLISRPSGPLTFQKQGEERKFKQWVTGQRPQPFVYYAYQMAKVYVTAGIHTLRLGRDRN